MHRIETKVTGGWWCGLLGCPLQEAGMIGIPAAAATLSAVAMLVVGFGCSGAGRGRGAEATVLTEGKCVPIQGRKTLRPQTFRALFEAGQAVYYIEENGTVLLLIRLKEEIDPAETLGKFLALAVRKFDFVCDDREKLILVCYQGALEERRNVGVMISVDDLKSLQEGRIEIDTLSERASYVEGLDVSSVQHLVVK